MLLSFQAFMTYDVEHNQGVTKGEFRRVLESFCLPLTSEQFEAVVAKVHNSVFVAYSKCETHMYPNLFKLWLQFASYTQSMSSQAHHFKKKSEIFKRKYILVLKLYSTARADSSRFHRSSLIDSTLCHIFDHPFVFISVIIKMPLYITWGQVIFRNIVFLHKFHIRLHFFWISLVVYIT